jgi:aspartyl-tRNA(Asn)/glutamyl-tRNA(Gln) amidotransferase subunit A
MAAAVQSHQQTARSFADRALERAAAWQDRFRSFIQITPELARQQAERVDGLVGQGRRLPLAGVPFAVKDLIDVAGLPTTCGSAAFQDTKAAAHATVVQRLIDAGAVLIGKLNLHECAFGFTGENPTFGNCRNPWDPQRIPGGSSSGSATAVVLEQAAFTLGSDTGGSIRLPAALCGLVGLKATYGRVSRFGVAPLSWTMDHVGPLTRTAADAALVLSVLAGHDPQDESSSRRPPPDYLAQLDTPLRGLRLGVHRKWFFESLEPDVAAAVEQAIHKLAELGAQPVEVALPLLEEVVGAHRAIIFPEAACYQRPSLESRAEKFGDDIRPLLLGGLFLPAVDYLHAQRVRRLVRHQWAKVFESIDCLLTPTSPMVASRFGQQRAELPGGEKLLVRAYLDLTLPFNLSGHPAVSVPCGFSQQRLPIGMQLVGRPFDEGTILRVAHQYQQQTDWHMRKPEGI